MPYWLSKTKISSSLLSPSSMPLLISSFFLVSPNPSAFPKSQAKKHVSHGYSLSYACKLGLSIGSLSRFHSPVSFMPTRGRLQHGTREPATRLQICDPIAKKGANGVAYQCLDIES
jgi:hypothetical protein